MKNEELNLAELLKDCPKGTKLYSPICGAVELVATLSPVYDYQIKTTANHNYYYFTREGYYETSGTPECVLFPSKDQRDWNVWKAEQNKNKNPFKVGDYVIYRNNLIHIITRIIDNNNVVANFINSTISTRLGTADLNKIDKYPIEHFKSFSPVLVRNSSSTKWTASYFSHYENPTHKFAANGRYYEQCVPYNEETKHLVGTIKEAPEFYINWQEE